MIYSKSPKSLLKIKYKYVCVKNLNNKSQFGNELFFNIKLKKQKLKKRKKINRKKFDI